MNLFAINLRETFSQLLYKLLKNKKTIPMKNIQHLNREDYSTICFRAAAMKPNGLAIVVDHG